MRAKDESDRSERGIRAEDESEGSEQRIRVKRFPTCSKGSGYLLLPNM